MDTRLAYRTAVDLWRKKSFRKLLHFLEAETPQFHDRAWWHEYRANALIGVGRFEEACVAYDDAIALAPDDLQLQLLKGETLLDELGRIDEAIACFDAVLARAPDSPDAHFFKGCALIERADWQHAAIVLQAGVRLSPKDAEMQKSLRLVQAKLTEAEALPRRRVNGSRVRTQN